MKDSGAPSLNELYRPFRLGTTQTLANPDLTPETLNGAELGGGWERGAFKLDADVFVNQLHRAVTNVTLTACPTNFPCSLQPGVHADPAAECRQYQCNGL